MHLREEGTTKDQRRLYESILDRMCSSNNNSNYSNYALEEPKSRHRRQETIMKNKQEVKHGSAWKGGRTQQSNGYILKFSPEHPNSDTRGYVLEHRLIVEKEIGRYLDPQEVVHHIDQDVTNNKKDNLMLFENAAAHNRYHKTLREPLMRFKAELKAAFNCLLKMQKQIEREEKVCSQPFCKRKIHAKGMCYKHYRQQRKLNESI